MMSDVVESEAGQGGCHLAAELIADLQRDGFERSQIEAKTSRTDLPKKLWRSISSFANSGGGYILLGLAEDKGFEVTGVNNPRKVSADLSSMLSHMKPPIRAEITQCEIGGKWVIMTEISEVEPRNKLCYYGPAGLQKGSYTRVGDADRLMSPYELQTLLDNRGQPKHDIEPVPDASLADLDAKLVNNFCNEARDETVNFRDLDDRAILKAFKAVTSTACGEFKPTVLGLLFFSRVPQTHFPQLAVSFTAHPAKIAGQRGPGGERYLDDQLITGPIPEMLDGAMRALKRNMTRRGLVQGMYREDLWEYPEVALREAVANALLHRDLSPSALGTKSQIHMFPDRIEITNPGGLFGPVTVDRLGEPGTEAARNAFLMRAATLITGPDGRHICEIRGSGIYSMISLMQEYGMSPPRFQDSLTRFRITLYNHTLLDQETLDVISSLDTDVTDSQRKVLAFLIHSNQPIDNVVYRRITGADSRDATKELASLVERGVLTRRGKGRWTTYSLMDESSTTLEQPDINMLDLEVSGADRASRDTKPGSGHPGLPGKGSLSGPKKRILEALATYTELSTHEISGRTSLKPQTVRYHLRGLREAGLVCSTTDTVRSPNVKYRLCAK